MLGLTNAAFAMRVSAFFNKEREICFEKSALCLAMAGEDEAGERSGTSDAASCFVLNPAKRCKLFKPSDVTQFLEALLSYINLSEHTDPSLRRTRARDATSALVIALVHFPFSFEPISSEHLNLLGKILNCIVRNWFTTRDLRTSSEEWFCSVTNGVISRMLTNYRGIYESYLAELQNLLEETISNILTCSPSKASARKLLDNWQAVDSAISLILDAIPMPVHQINEDCCFNFLKFTLDLLSREILNSQSVLLDMLQSPSLAHDDFDSVCCLLVLWGQLSQKMQIFNKSHVTPLPSTEAVSSDVHDTQTEVVEGDSKDHGAHVFVSNMDSEFPSWSALQSTAKDFGHEKLKSVLKNRLQPPIERDHTEDHADALAPDLNLLHELHRPINFHTSLSRALLATLEQSMAQVRLATAPTPVLLTLFDTLTRPDGPEDRSAGTRLSLLLQTPVFCTAAYGPLFNAAGISLVDEAAVSSDESTPAATASSTSAGADQPISSNFTVQSATSAWMGASGTGAGLPSPNIIVSSSVQEFVSLTVTSLLPALLTLLEADKRNWHLYTVTPNTESDHDESCPHEAHSSEETHLSTTPTNLPKPPIDLSTHYGRHPAFTRQQISVASSSMDEDSFYSTVAPILNALVQFLSGQSFTLRTQPAPDSGFGILAQITEVVLSTDEQDLVTQERVALSIADCLILRSLCHLLSVLFRSHFKLSTAAVADTSLFSANTDISSQFAEFAKQYDSAIRILSEHITDLAAIYGNNLIVEHSLPTTDHWPKLPTTGCCSPNVRALHGFLRRLWYSLGRTCPAGLARQLLAHVGAQCLGTFVQLFATNEYTSQVDSTIARNDAWIALKTAEFCLFASSETVADLVGLSQQNIDLNLIHSTATLLAQILLCRYMPEATWSNLHDGGFYKRVLAEEKPFDFAVANWLHLSNRALFPDPPFVLMREDRLQTELEVEWELFAASQHFDPIRLLSMICSSEARLSAAILSRDAFSSPTDDTDEMDSIVRVMAALFGVCALVPGLEMFHTGVITAYLATDPLAALPSIDSLSFTDGKWPIWLRAILRTLEEPLNRVWSRFKQLVEWHVSQDEAFSSQEISISSTTQDAVFLLAHHQPQTRTFWTNLVSNTCLPCGCDLPKPPALGPELPVNCPASVEGRQSQSTNQDRAYTTRSSRTQVAYDRWHKEQHRGSYVAYILCGGQQCQAWRELARDMIHLGVMSVPVGLQLALATLDDELESSTGLRRGGLTWLHLVLLSLSMRIRNEFPQDRVRVVQHAVLLEYLASLLESKQDEEIVNCKDRLQKHLENLKASQWSYPEYIGHSSAGRTFRLAQLVRLVQQHALPELYFLHAFFKCNIPWIRAVIRSLRTQSASSGVDSAVQPLFDFAEHGQLKLCADDEPVMELSEIEHLDWDRIGMINFGLAESTMHMLRPQPEQLATPPKADCTTVEGIVM